MKIKDILAAKGKEVFTVDEDKSVHDAVKLLVEHKIGALLVLNSKQELVGIISERDILRECVDGSGALKKTRISTVMTSKLIIGFPSDDLDDTMGVLTHNRIRHLPIMDNEQIVGIISLGDIVKQQLDDREYENRYLQQYMFGH